MAKQTVKKETSTTTLTRTTITLRPKSRSELSDQRSKQAKSQKRNAKGQFV